MSVIGSFIVHVWTQYYTEMACSACSVYMHVSPVQFITLSMLYSGTETAWAMLLYS